MPRSSHRIRFDHWGNPIVDDLRPTPDSDLQRHDPPRSRISHPYSFDPHTIWGKPFPDRRCNATDYTDRLEQWDYAKYTRLIQKICASGARPFDGYNCRGDLIEQFLREYHDDPTIKLLRVIAECNVATGYPLWRLDYRTERRA